MRRRWLDMLLVVEQFGPESWQDEEQRSLLEVTLRHAKFEPFEIQRLMAWLDQVVREPEFPAWWERMVRNLHNEPTQVLRMTDRAHHFLTSVRDLGLIDSAMEEQILNQLMLATDDRLDLEDIRRTAARVIFERQFQSSEDYYGIFEEEWKLLFN